MTLPVVADLEGARDALEAQVPRTLASEEDWTLVADGRVGVKYRLTRSPFSVAVQGDELAGGRHRALRRRGLPARAALAAEGPRLPARGELRAG